MDLVEWKIASSKPSRSTKLRVWEGTRGAAGSKGTAGASNVPTVKCTMDMGKAGFPHRSSNYGMTFIIGAMAPTMSSPLEEFTKNQATTMDKA
jgi:hypothetical protein